MKKKLNEIQEAEFLFIRKWCLTILDFLYSNDTTLTFLIELRRQAFGEETKIRFLEKVSPAVYIKGLRQACNDINEMALHAPSTTLIELNNILFAKFGRDLNTYSKNVSSLLEEILKRGQINNDEEFRLVEQIVSDVSQIDSQSQQIIVFNNLLTAYYMSKK